MDQPIAYTKEGRPLFDNTPTVVCMLVPDRRYLKLLAVRRANMPGRGLLGLPGGYHMRDETWQEGGAREVKEETGYSVDPQTAALQSLVTDEYGNNLVIAYANAPEAFQLSIQDASEVQEVLWLESALTAEDWAFPRHYEAAKRYFETGRRK
ncbi:NUDIX domain-containing protein [Ochrobactrum sp. BTU1]|uniref:NUDIX domain-containing protein n=1 Tax=Ochrobactrum sp. BTU1 TaxID=2840456 RepID=UPI001C03AF4E|nr:NUDIX hydrolase [Ochrobactrum sp. BTU1]